MSTLKENFFKNTGLAVNPLAEGLMCEAWGKRRQISPTERFMSDNQGNIVDVNTGKTFGPGTPEMQMYLDAGGSLVNKDIERMTRGKGYMSALDGQQPPEVNREIGV